MKVHGVPVGRALIPPDGVLLASNPVSARVEDVEDEISWLMVIPSRKAVASPDAFSPLNMIVCDPAVAANDVVASDW